LGEREALSLESFGFSLKRSVTLYKRAHTRGVLKARAHRPCALYSLGEHAELTPSAKLILITTHRFKLREGVGLPVERGRGHKVPPQLIITHTGYHLMKLKAL
jgi:hypothetical protein